MITSDLLNYAAFAIVVGAVALLGSNYGKGQNTRMATWVSWVAILNVFWLFIIAMFGRC